MVVQGGRRSARRRTLVIAASVTAAVVVVLGALSTVYTEILWFRETGFGNVYWTAIWAKVALGAIFGAAFAILMLVNLWIARRITSPARLFTVPDQILERYRATLQPYVKLVVIGGALLFGVFAGSGATVKWRDWLMFRNAVHVGQTDPVFHRDIGFYLFKLPFHQFLFTWAFSTLIVVTLVVGLAHYFMGGIRPQARGERVSPEVRAHLSVLLGLIVLLKAWGYRLDQFNLLYSPRGTVQGASYTDVHATLPALRLLTIIAIVCSVFFLINARFKNWLLPLAGIGILALTSIVAGGIYPAGVQRLRVTPNERIREREFIDRTIKATRFAFGIDKVEARSLPAGEVLTKSALARQRDTVSNIRLWDPLVLRTAYIALQRIKPFYEFLDVDVDRYTINGKRRQVMIAPRELDLAGLDGSARTWLNNHLVYTHGYGLAANNVSNATSDGQPSFVLRNIPPAGISGAPIIKQPQIYFGEREEVPFVVVHSAQEELDFPREGSDSVQNTKYTGKGGIALDSVLKRAAFAWRFRDVNLLISGAITKDSRIMMRRAVDERARRAAPFLKLDPDPYVAVIDGKIKWIIDAYTTSTMWPYAQRIDLAPPTDGFLTGRANYMRNSVKFVVDAQDGTIDIYRWDEQDPVLAVWAKIFPNLFKPKSEMSKELLSHVRYPEQLFKVQTDRFANYHVTNPDTFYQKNDSWLVANDPTFDLNDAPYQPFSSRVVPYYVLMKLPGEQGLDFVLARPFTPSKRENLTSYMVAHSDPDQYGKLVSYELPRNENVLGPTQVQTRINSEPAISQYITLNSTAGSRVIYGNLLVVPIEKALMYVQPLYVLGSGSPLPELKRVVAVFGDKVEMADTLQDALAQVFGKDTGGEETPPTASETVADLVGRARAECDRADEAAKKGDLEGFGRHYRKCKDLVDRAAQQATPAPSPS